MKRVAAVVALTLIMSILGGCYSTCQQPVPEPVAYKGAG